MHLDLIFVGFGKVGRRFARMLREQEARLAADHGLEWRVVGIRTWRHGTARNTAGLDVARALDTVEGDLTLAALDEPTSLAGSPDMPTSAVGFIEQLARARADRGHVPVVVETTVLDIRSGQPAIDHVRAALRSGAHVLSANKGPAAFAYRELAELARERHRCFLFEGAVMDGVPIFNLVRETMPAVRVSGFRGVVNSTTNHVLTVLEEGGEFDEALAQMQAAGTTEADVSLDVDGWDAAAKTAALINVLMDGETTPAAIERTGIGSISGRAVRDAVRRGRRVKLVASARREAGRVVGRVAPEEVPESDLLATLRGMQNALVVDTDLLGRVAITQLDAGLTQTSYALLSDLIAVRRRLSGR